MEPVQLEPVEPAPESRGDLANALLIPLVRSRWIVVACTVLGTAAGIALGITKPNNYVSIGKLLVRASSQEETTPQSVISGPGGAGGGQIREQVNNEMQLLAVPQVYELVAKKVTPPRIFSAYDPAADDKDDTPYFTKMFHAYQAKWFKRGGGEKSKKIGHELDGCPKCVSEAVHVLETDLHMGVEPGSSVITIGYGAHEPELAREVVSAFMEAAETHHREAFSTNSTLDFVRNRFSESEKAEQETSTEFSEYRTNCGVTDYETQRVAFMTEVNELEKAQATDAQKLETLKSKERVVAEQISNVKPMIPQSIERSPLQNPVWVSLQTRVQTLQDNLEDLGSHAGGTTAEREAQRLSLQNRIDRARAELDRTEPLVPQAPTVQSAPNPEYLRLKQDVDQTQQQIAEQEAIVAKSAERLKNAQDRLKNIESCAPRYKFLEGEYMAAKASKESYAKALERATTANLLDELQFSNLRRIQDASLPYEKEGPKRSKFVLIGVILGFVTGAGFAFLRLQLDSRLRAPAEVETVTGTKVLSVVPPSGLSWRLRRAIQRASG